jgi:hypothetical protein
MQVVHERCAGLGVHKKNVYGCIVVLEDNNKKKQEVRSFGKMTADLVKLAEWLREHDHPRGDGGNRSFLASSMGRTRRTVRVDAGESSSH